MKRNQDEQKLRKWRERLRVAQSAYQDDLDRMDRREKLYAGEVRDTGADDLTGEKHETPRVRNICAEMIESQINADIPMPKVTALNEQDEWLAKLVEDMLRDEVRRLHAQVMMDRMQRTVPVQGGGFWHVEWDNSLRTHTTVGEISLRDLHPKWLIPQPGVTGDLEDMDYFFLVIPETRGGISERYGADVSQEREEDPGIRGYGDEEHSEDMVTQYVAYYRAAGGAVGRFSWVGDVVLEDNPDYLARRLRKCVQCGAPEPEEGETLDLQTLDGRKPGGGGPELPEDAELPAPRVRAGGGKTRCPYCGGTRWEERNQEEEEVWQEMTFARPDGSTLIIPGAKEIWEPTGELDPMTMLPVTGFMGRREPTRIPYYRVKKYPVILQRNVSRFGKLLGGSDIDKLEDHQLSQNYLDWKMHEKLSTGGSYLTLPEKDAYIEVNDQQLKIVRLSNAADKGMIDVITVEADIGQDIARQADIYEQVKQTIGVTESFLGRVDPSATSGKAKEFAAAQTAGRQQSKATMRDTAWARIYELMFQMKLSYADEPRAVVGNDANGRRTYNEFNRYLFLRQDEAGEWYWNDRFLFETDTAAPLATNQEAMWQETRSHFQSGAFGDPTAIDTLILYWSQMAKLHYPTAEDIVTALKDRQERQRQLAQLQQQMAAQQAAAPGMNQPRAEDQMPLPG